MMSTAYIQVHFRVSKHYEPWEHRGGFRISGKGVYIYKSVWGGGEFPLLILSHSS